MSKSRLEKFLYALYSLDSSDLPTPLSRIEELYKCLVTGEEAPTFEPLSRVEKYLMAILGGYDVDSLPNPLSRVEVLLYKLATGDDNLDDVKSFLSEHEELLAEIIRNGGVGGNIDIEYVLYTLSTEFNTLYNTAEKPVKSAILKGQTLVNLLPNKGKQRVSDSGSGNRTVKYPLPHTLKKNTKYLVYYNVEDISNPSGSNSLQISMYSEDASVVDFIDSIDKAGLRKHIFTTSDKDFEQPSVWFFVFKGETTEAIFDEVMILEYQDGMENWDIPYFEGMQSVKMPVLTTTGKNLFDGRIADDGKRIISTGIVINDNNYILSEYTVITNNVFYISNISGGYSSFYDENKNHISTFWSGAGSIAPTNAKYVRHSIEKASIEKFMFEQNTTSTEYEPHKSNILTVNEDVTLRSNGDVYDELNLLTGRLTQRIDENNEVLSQEVVKTVDLSVVDQDVNDTKLSTFNDITHVTLSSEGLIPEAELEVATKNEEVLNTMSLEMDDISTTQNALQETSDNQSENVDSTMIATTEIYEGLL